MVSRMVQYVRWNVTNTIGNRILQMYLIVLLIKIVFSSALLVASFIESILKNEDTHTHTHVHKHTHVHTHTHTQRTLHTHRVGGKRVSGGGREKDIERDRGN